MRSLLGATHKVYLTKSMPCGMLLCMIANDAPRRPIRVPKGHTGVDLTRIPYGFRNRATFRAIKYIKNKSRGMNKKDAMIAAGYDESTARTPKRTEARESYAVALKYLLDDNHYKMRNISDLLDERIAEGLTDMSSKDMVEVQYKLAKIHQILTPSVTVKESTDKDGTIRRTQWSSVNIPLDNNQV